MMEHYLSVFKKILFFACTMLWMHSAIGQDLTVSGKVTGADDGAELPGVAISVKGTVRGTITDFDGNYQIKAQKGATLVFSFIGYKQQEIVVENDVQNVTLELDNQALDEIVVIGYGQVKKEDATGSVTAVDSDDFNKGAITSPQELIVGKTAGVVITTSGGAPGSDAQIRIRGGSSLNATNDPLIIIDGVPISNTDIDGMSNPLSVINPNDIETFTVLKDASATAIYGSRASNGVILITTKKGKSGKQMKISYNGSLSIGVPTDYLEVHSGDEMRKIMYDRVQAGQISEVALSRLGNANTDWQDEVYQNAVSHDHNVSVAGAYKMLPYRVSVGYTDQDGIMKYSNMKRTTAAVNLNPSLLNDMLKISANAKFMKIKNNFSNDDARGRSLQMDPTQPIKNGNTEYGGYFTWVDLTDADQLNGVPINIATHNPVASLEFRDNTSEATRFIGNAQFDYSLPWIPGLRANLNLAYDITDSDGDDNMDKNASWRHREPNRNIRNYTMTQKNSLFDFYINYNKDLSSIASKIDVTAGYSWQHFHYEMEEAVRPIILPDDFNADDFTDIAKRENYLVSFFGRLNYILLNRYLFTATVRQDGSSRFHEDNRWGIFPSLAFAWKIKEEAFLKDVKVLSELKLRLGYGLTGQQDIGGDWYPYMTYYTQSLVGAYYQFGDKFYPTQRPKRYDPDIKWESTTTQNIGLDFGFLDGRITGSFDYYDRETKDLLNEIPVAAGTNFSNFLITNVGTLTNKGFEATLNFTAISTKDMSLDVGVNLTHNKNEITKLTKVDDPDYVGYDTGDIDGGAGNRVQIHSVGHPASTFLLFKQVYDNDGKPIEGLYVDKTGEGGVVSGNNLNKYYMHDPAPEYLIGLSVNFDYKNFDLSMGGRINVGNYVYNNNASNMALYQNLYNQSGYASNILTAVNDTKFQTAQYWSDFYLHDASFFRMDNISLGYRFNSLLTDKLNGRVSFTVQNAFTITDYPGLDPEVENGIDRNIYPRPRTFMLGLNLEF